MADFTLDDFEIEGEGQPQQKQLTLDDFETVPVRKAKVARPKSAEPLVVKPKAEIYKTLGEMSTPEYAIQQQYKLKKPRIKAKGKMPDSQAFTDKIVGQMQGYNLGPDGKPATAFKLPEETTEDFLQRAGDLQRAKDQQDQATRMKGRMEAAAKLSQWQSLPTSFAKGAGETLLQTAKGAKVMGETLMGTSSPDEIYFQPQSGPVTKDDFVNHLSSALGAFVPQTAIGMLTGHLGTVAQGALQNSAQAYDEAKQSGADDDTAKLSAGLGLVIGSLAGLGPQAFGARLAQAQGDLLQKGWQSWAKETLQPAGVMAAQTFLNNVNAKIGAGYDPQRALMQGVAESGLIGGILGLGGKGIAEGVDALGRRRGGEISEQPKVDSKLPDVRASFAETPFDNSPESQKSYVRNRLDSLALTPDFSGAGRFHALDSEGNYVYTSKEMETLQRRAEDAGYETVDDYMADRGDDTAFRAATPHEEELLARVRERALENHQAFTEGRQPRSELEIRKVRLKNEWRKAQKEYERLSKDPNADKLELISAKERVKGLEEELGGDGGVRASFAQDYRSAAREFVKGSRGADEEGNPIEVFHGTQSPKEITELDFSKLDPNALYGPEFYMTQDVDVAAGEGGYALTKGNRAAKVLTDEEAIAHPQYKKSFDRYQQSDLDEAGDGTNFHPNVSEEAKQNLLKLNHEQAILDAKRVYEDAQNVPHVYKLYHNIKNPIDMDAPSEFSTKERILSLFDPKQDRDQDAQTLEVRLRSSRTNDDIYHALVGALGSKVEANKFLRRLGYDGITHIGGGRWGLSDAVDSRTFANKRDAEQLAEKIGGRVVEKRQIEDENPEYNKIQRRIQDLQGALTDYQNKVKGSEATIAWLGGMDKVKQELGELLDVIEYTPKTIHKPLGYTVEGHRVWIAFDPKQVKSATGNRGTFDVNSPRISESIAEKPNLAEMEQRARDAGHVIALTPKTRADFQVEADRLMEAMKTMEPSDPGFVEVSKRWIELNRAIADSEGIESINTAKDLQDHVQRINLGHVGDTEQMLKDLGSVMPQASSPDSEFVTGQAVDAIKEGGYKMVYGTEGGKAPVLYMPDKVFEALGHKMVGGLNFPLRELPKQIRKVENSSLFAEGERQQAIESLRLIGRASDAEGLSSVSVLNSNTHPINFQKVTHHETFHAGQQEALESLAGSAGVDAAQFDLGHLHSREWAENHPALKTFAQTPIGRWYLEGAAPGRGKDTLAYELAAFIAGGQYYVEGSDGLRKTTGLTTGEGIDYLTDYVQHIVDMNGEAGLQALDALTRAAELRTNISETLDLARSLQRAEPSSIDSIRAKGQQESDLNVANQTVRASVLGDEEGGLVKREGKDGVEGIHQESGDGGSGDDNSALVVEDAWKREPLFKVIVNDPFITKTAEAFKKLMRDGGVEYDPEIPPSIQIKDAILRGDLRPEGVEDVLTQNGLTWADFAEAGLRTESVAGKILNRLSQTAKLNQKMIRENPELAVKLGENAKMLKQVVKDLELSKLGQNWYQRLSADQVKALLGTVQIAMNNVITTTARLPLDLVTPAMAGWVVGRKQFIKANPDATMAEAAYAGAKMAKEAIKPALNVIQAMKPGELWQALNRTQVDWEAAKDVAKMRLGRAGDVVTFGKGDFGQHVEDLVTTLEQYFPEYHTKLHGLSSGIETRGEDPGHWIQFLKDRLPEIKDKDEKAELTKKIATFEARDKFNNSLVGKAIGGYEWGLDMALAPSNTQEFFFRKPYFVGALDRELTLRGLSLHEMIIDGKLASIPKGAMEAAVDVALTFTFAYKPKADAPGTVGVERAMAGFVKTINGFGLLGHTFGEMLPQAMYNGAKFWYEYGALGAIRPAIKLMNGETKPDTEFHDQHRLAQAAVGTMLYAGILSVAGKIFGDEWYKLKTERKGKDGRPIYLDARGMMGQFAPFFFMAHTIHKYQSDDIRDWKKVSAQASQVFLNARKDTDTSPALQAFQKMWGGSEQLSGEESKSVLPVGQFLANWLRPALNLRDAIAEFNEEENVKKDLKQSPLFGPSMDSIPWLRRRLPNLSSPEEPSPIELSRHPGVAQFTGVKTVLGLPKGSAEINRLGISINKWLQRDPDPLINRVQNEVFEKIIQEQAEAFLKDPVYANADEKMKRAMWERAVTRKNGIAAYAKKMGERANQLEMMKRGLKREAGPFKREAYGIDKEIEKIK